MTVHHHNKVTEYCKINPIAQLCMNCKMFKPAKTTNRIHKVGRCQNKGRFVNQYSSCEQFKIREETDKEYEERLMGLSEIVNR